MQWIRREEAQGSLWTCHSLTMVFLPYLLISLDLSTPLEWMVWSRQLSRSSSALSFSDLLPLRGHGGFLIGQWGSEGRECWPTRQRLCMLYKERGCQGGILSLSSSGSPSFSLNKVSVESIGPRDASGGFWVGLSAESCVSAEPTAFAERVD